MASSSNPLPGGNPAQEEDLTEEEQVELLMALTATEVADSPRLADDQI